MAETLMVQGTSADAGRVLTTGLAAGLDLEKT